jgi:hypothetical protein
VRTSQRQRGLMNRFLSFLLLVLSSHSMANFSSLDEENRYNSFKILISQNKSKMPFVFDQAEQKLFVDALWDSEEVDKINRKI